MLFKYWFLEIYNNFLYIDQMNIVIKEKMYILKS
jgi:hypothetical protein